MRKRSHNLSILVLLLVPSTGASSSSIDRCRPLSYGGCAAAPLRRRVDHDDPRDERARAVGVRRRHDREEAQ